MSACGRLAAVAEPQFFASKKAQNVWSVPPCPVAMSWHRSSVLPAYFPGNCCLNKSDKERGPQTLRLAPFAKRICH